ncbi:MAG: hypothetical protein ABSC88_06215 [Terracidiphilus sp.]|jgi:acetyl-CoA acetyltransferase
MGIGSITAIPKALSRAGLTLDDIGLIEMSRPAFPGGCHIEGS